MPEIELGFPISLCRLHSIIRKQVYIGGFNAIKKEIDRAAVVRLAMNLEGLQTMFANNGSQTGWTSIDIDDDQHIFGLLLGYISPNYSLHNGSGNTHYLVMIENNVFCVETVDVECIREDFKKLS